MFNRAHTLATYMVPLLTVRVFTSKPFCFHDTDLLQVPQGYFLCLVAWSFVSNSWTWKAFHDFFRGRPVAHHVKIRFGLFFIVRTIAKPANRIAENLYRFSIWTTSQNVPNLSLVSFHPKVRTACEQAKSSGILASHGKRPSRPRPNYFFLFGFFPSWFFYVRSSFFLRF